ncbi:MAG: hypothetical protein ACRDHL_09660 [Candidatus Promineifilaceae bacterium]
MVGVQALKKLDPAAWTGLLAHHSNGTPLRVAAVQAEPIGRRQSRFLLWLEAHSEPIALLGKQTGATEARFYHDLAGRLPELTPRCWYSHVSGDRSWVVLDEVVNDFPARRWMPADLERVIRELAQLHATFWQEGESLHGLGLSRLLDDGAGRRIPVLDAEVPLDGLELEPAAVALSAHSRRRFGPLAALMQEASVGLRQLYDVGGWPGIFEEAHIQAAAELLDDPVPMLFPLSQQPATLLHGDPAAHNWHLSVLGEYKLLNWDQAAVGPGLVDLITFIEQFALLRLEAGGWPAWNEWQVLEETMEDGYILTMGRLLGSRFSPAAARQAIPAARCLYVLSYWLPIFAHWLSLPHDRELWRNLNAQSDANWDRSGFGQMARLRPHLAGVFRRFLEARYAL